MKLPGLSSSDGLDERLLRDRVSTLYSTGWLMTGGNLVVAAGVLAMAHRIVPMALMIGWPIFLVVLALLHEVAIHRYRRAARGPHDPVYWGRIYTLFRIVRGVSWGGVLAYLALKAEPWELAAMIGLLTVSVVGAAANAVYSASYEGYLVTAVLPLIAALLWRGDQTGLGLAGFGFIIGLAGFGIGRKLGAVVVTSLRLRLANADLVERLELAIGRAEAANQAKSHFLASMSHELRTPLNAVIGYSEMLLEDAQSEGRPDQAADLEKITGAGRHLLSLVNNILDLSKVEAGRMELAAERVELDALIDEVVTTCQPLIERNGNTLVTQCDADLGAIFADGTKLRQILLNLLSNAAKFTERGRITLSVARERRGSGDWLRIAVRDTGIGISADALARLFSQFTQADRSIAGKYGGTGLGLALSQQLCRLMGGEISAESEPGRGSCFTMRVPVAAGG